MLGRHARAAAEPLSWDRVVAAFEAVLRKAAGAAESEPRESHAAA
jgi:hypothetical protein